MSNTKPILENLNDSIDKIRKELLAVNPSTLTTEEQKESLKNAWKKYYVLVEERDSAAKLILDGALEKGNAGLQEMNIRIGELNKNVTDYQEKLKKIESVLDYIIAGVKTGISIAKGIVAPGSNILG